MNPSYLILDFDNTIIRGETMDELARISLSNSPEKDKIISEIEQITALGMAGEMPFDESLSKRIKLLKAHKTHVGLLISTLKKRIDTSIINNTEFFKRHRRKIYIISGGFTSVINRVLEDMPFNENQIYGNELMFDDGGWITRVNKENFLSKKNGKSALLNSLKLSGAIATIGDGFSDAEMKLSGEADMFFAYTGHILRESVLHHSDFTVSSFDEIIQLLSEWD